MSAIFGILSTAGSSVNQQRLTDMGNSLVHRGPDDYGQWIHKSIGIGHRMLRTTPESNVEHLPFVCPETGLAITADVRLDNRDELIHAIGKNRFKTDIIPDSLIIIYSYLKWQDKCINNFLGDFAFVIWDEDARKLFCARDHFGIKPFYYYFSGGEFIFCSESGTIAGCSGIRAPINEARIADHLTPHMEGFDKTSTFYKNITRLPPAHSLTIKQRQLKINQYWSPGEGKSLTMAGDNEHIDAFNEVLTRAVSDRCRCIGEPGIILSGGVDSASIMAIAANRNTTGKNKTIRTYSGFSDAPENCKESQLIKTLTNNKGTYSVLYTPRDLANDVENVFSLVSKIQEPFDIGMILIFALYKKAAQEGTKVILDGVDGDVLTSLSPQYPSSLFRNGLILSGLKETFQQSRFFYDNYYSIPTLLFHYLRSSAAPTLIKRMKSKFTLKKRVAKIINDSLLSHGFCQQIQFENRLKIFEEKHQQQKLSFPQGQYLNGLTHPFLTVGIERYDRVASLCSVEPRHPLADKRVADFFAGLPWNQMVRNGWTKYLLRKVAELYLPQEVCWRSGKEHLGWSFSESFISEKTKFINNVISDRYRFLGTITNYNIEINRNQPYNISEEIKNKSHLLNIAGLAMWLGNQ